MSISNNTPSPEELQKKLQEFMKTQYGDKVVIAAAAPQAETAQTGETGPEQKEKAYDFEFDFKPKDIKAHLDRFVIKQDDAKKVLSIAVCDHYNHVKMVESDKAKGEYNKQNVILIGPTGVGKTYLIRCIAELIGVPFVKGDATKFSETGYVGGDVEDLIRELVQRADGDVKLAQYGIIYLDEIDKIATPPNIIGRDVSGRGVQTNLLKLMEETEVPLRSPTDIQAQLQAAFEYQRKGKSKKETINTRHILFIASGAFDKMEEIVRTRLRQANIGFGASTREEVSTAQLYRQVTTQDFIKFGYEPEFIGRLPVRVVCDELGVDDLYHILKNSEGSVIHQYESSFSAFGIEVIFSDDALLAIAEQAATEKTGARGLVTVCERVLREYKYELPSSTLKQFVVNRTVVEHPIRELQRILQNSASEERVVLREMVFEWAERFSQKHTLKLRFLDDAVNAIVDCALHQKKPVREMCNQLFKDYEFGLGLIRKNNGQTEFEIPSVAIENPDKFLSDLVVASYRGGEPKQAAAGS
ncbi:MAG: AAA family ATPase [Verrucomicrobiae bacterium]|nr:AAA family ATPase [Verrucomicrobiae bacterium]